jgi:2-amino-4-hydroxy-6-hydroxymethyldihydropteridine diphosphokinase/dihydropteroate synthase
MAIMNFTPDSFSNDGVNTPNKELELSSLHLTAKLTAERGADIIDVGGQSSAPGAFDVTADEEIFRTVPAIGVLKATEEFKGAISIDTYRAEVAEAAVNAGADIINDISAGQLDKEMLPTMARLGKTVCLMHMRGTPQTMQRKEYTDYEPKGLIPTIAEELLERVAEAEAAGIRRWRIILDPGIGFAKTSEHALEILRRLDELRDWPGLRGLPWLVGSSRKGFVGKITNCHLPHQRTSGTAATVAAAIHGGADIVRVHDVAQMARVALMSDAIWRV